MIGAAWRWFFPSDHELSVQEDEDNLGYWIEKHPFVNDERHIDALLRSIERGVRV